MKEKPTFRLTHFQLFLIVNIGFLLMSDKDYTVKQFMLGLTVSPEFRFLDHDEEVIMETDFANLFAYFLIGVVYDFVCR